jgi:hypothetical protein
MKVLELSAMRACILEIMDNHNKNSHKYMDLTIMYNRLGDEIESLISQHLDAHDK